MDRQLVRRVTAAVSAALVAVVVMVLGWIKPPVTPVVTTDRLGPENGEAIADYLNRARESLRGSDSDQHWALISFTAAISADRIPEYAGGLRISEVLYHVELPRVVTPIVAVPVAAGDAAALRSVQLAAGELAHEATVEGARTRAGRIAAVAAARLAANCACTVGLVVRGTLDQLRNLSSHTDIRAVEALPAAAAGGTFAVVPLLPEYQEFAAPGSDDGPVPDQ
ncbi:hypothetical protein [Nocardia sp. NPDC050406]|uniref:hypothetical protein n=1 Tax=Nocardia sp. NPDC050406 TaxID=3364318 RepID=UPI0037A03CB7